MLTVKSITEVFNEFAPAVFQESYDNAGLLTGNPEWLVKNILVTVDITEEVINEAINNNCNLIIAHHPIIFKGLKAITGSNYVERSLILAIKSDIAIYASHTNLDNVKNGVNFKMAQKLNLQEPKILSPKKETLKKLTVFVPLEHAETLTHALHQAGAGNIGNYSDCSFKTEGTGSFKPNELAHPAIGTKNMLEHVTENRIEMLFPLNVERKVLTAMKENHPYEEVAYYITPIENLNQDIGSGVIGTLSTEMRSEYFIEKLKATFRLKVVRHTKYIKATIKTVALCGGAGSFLLNDAISHQADVYISGDFKYHEFFNADNKIIIADIGHYESEQYTKELFSEIILKKFPNIAVLFSKVNTNPVFYT